MTNLNLFYVVFIAQIFLLTVYFPGKLLQRIRFVRRNYPASSHPKLYPKSTNFYRIMSNIFGLLNGLIFILGWVIVYYIYEGSLVGEKGVNNMLPWAYFMVQMIPTWIVNLLGFRMSKLMKLEDTRTTKSANLVPRHLFHYISPVLFGSTILVYLGVVLFAFYLEGFQFDIGGKAFLMSGILLLGYIFFFIMITVLIYGKKSDPYQSQQDRTQFISLAIKTYCYTMIVCAVFMGFAIAAGSFNLEPLMPVAMSLFLQLNIIISMGYILHNSRLEDIDFDVYRAESD